MKENRILIIDDEADIRNFLRAALESEKYAVAEAETGHSGLTETNNFHPHLIILDLGLPDMSGSQVLSELRKWTTVPILILTVDDNDATKVALLDGGADDYLTKPFSTPELLARVRVALRNHNSQAATPLFKSDGLEIDLNHRTVRLNGSPVELTATEFELLGRLVRGNGQVVTHQTLLKEVWGPLAVDKPHYLRVYIGQLRKKIEVNPSVPVHLVTDAGLGYRLL